MSSEQPDLELSETAQQINDLFDSAELSKAIETVEFKQFLDYNPHRHLGLELLAAISASAMRTKHSKLLSARHEGLRRQGLVDIGWVQGRRRLERHA
jgi:hypothetical protein